MSLRIPPVGRRSIPDSYFAPELAEHAAWGKVLRTGDSQEAFQQKADSGLAPVSE